MVPPAVCDAATAYHAATTQHVKDQYELRLQAIVDYCQEELAKGRKVVVETKPVRKPKRINVTY